MPSFKIVQVSSGSFLSLVAFNFSPLPKGGDLCDLHLLKCTQVVSTFGIACVFKNTLYGFENNVCSGGWKELS